MHQLGMVFRTTRRSPGAASKPCIRVRKQVAEPVGEAWPLILRLKRNPSRVASFTSSPERSAWHLSFLSSASASAWLAFARSSPCLFGLLRYEAGQGGEARRGSRTDVLCRRDRQSRWHLGHRPVVAGEAPGWPAPHPPRIFGGGGGGSSRDAPRQRADERGFPPRSQSSSPTRAPQDRALSRSCRVFFARADRGSSPGAAQASQRWNHKTRQGPLGSLLVAR